MQITVCDLCKKKGEEVRINHWVELRWSHSILATFTGVPDKKLELCESCFYRLTAPLPTTSPK